MRASSVVKRQSTRIASRFRCFCHAPVSCARTPWLGIRRSRHCRASTPSSISAIFDSRASACSVSPAVRRCAAPPPARRPRTGTPGDGCSSWHYPLLVRVASFRTTSMTSTRRHPSKGANSMNRLLTPFRWYSCVGHGCPGPRREGLAGLLHRLLGPSTPRPHCPGIPMIDLQHVLHGAHEFGAALGREAPGQGLSSFFSESGAPSPG